MSSYSGQTSSAPADDNLLEQTTDCGLTLESSLALLQEQEEAWVFLFDSLRSRLTNIRKAIGDRARLLASMSFKRLLQFGLPRHFEESQTTSSSSAPVQSSKELRRTAETRQKMTSLGKETVDAIDEVVQGTFEQWANSSEKLTQEWQNLRQAIPQCESKDKPTPVAKKLHEELETLGKSWMHFIVMHLSSMEDHMETLLRSLDSTIDLALGDALTAENLDGFQEEDRRMKTSFIEMLKTKLATTMSPFSRRVIEDYLFEASKDLRRGANQKLHQQINSASEAAMQMEETIQRLADVLSQVENTKKELRKTLRNSEKSVLDTWKSGLAELLLDEDTTAHQLQESLRIVDQDGRGTVEGSSNAGTTVSTMVLFVESLSDEQSNVESENITVSMSLSRAKARQVSVVAAGPTSNAVLLNSRPSVQALAGAHFRARELKHDHILIPSGILRDETSTTVGFLVPKRGKTQLLQDFLQWTKVGGRNLFEEAGTPSRILKRLQERSLHRLSLRDVIIMKEIARACLTANEANVQVLRPDTETVLISQEKGTVKASVIPVDTREGQSACSELNTEIVPVDIANFILSVWRLGTGKRLYQQSETEDVRYSDLNDTLDHLRSVYCPKHTLAGALLEILELCCSNGEDSLFLSHVCAYLDNLSTWAALTVSEIIDDSSSPRKDLENVIIDEHAPSAFVSFPFEDEHLAVDVQQVLSSASIGSWAPVDGSSRDCPNMCYKRTTIAARADSFLALVSKNWIKSPFCRAELNAYMTKGSGHMLGFRSLFLICLDDIDIEEILAEFPKRLGEDKPNLFSPAVLSLKGLHSPTERAKFLSAIRTGIDSANRFKRHLQKTRKEMDLKLEQSATSRSAPSSPRTPLFLATSNLRTQTGVLDDTESSLTVPMMTVSLEERKKRKEARKQMESNLLRYTFSRGSKTDRFHDVYGSLGHHRLWFVHDNLTMLTASKTSSPRSPGMSPSSTYGMWNETTSRLSARLTQTPNSRISTAPSSLQGSPVRSSTAGRRDLDVGALKEELSLSPFTTLDKALRLPGMRRVVPPTQIGVQSPRKKSQKPTALTADDCAPGISHFDQWKRVVSWH